MSGIQLTIVNNVVTNATYTSGSKECRIPYAVTAIGNNAFNNVKKIIADVFTSNVITIGTDAFKDCTALTNIIIPVFTSIGDSAFYGCIALANITIPSVTHIGNSAFYGCIALTGITIPLTVTSVGDSAFSGCNKPNFTINIQNAIIGNRMFQNCGASQITIPSSVTSIGNYAFDSLPNLLNATINNSFLSTNMFSNCNSLTSITIPSSVTSIGANAFSNCINLTNVLLQRTHIQGVTILNTGSFTNTPNVSVDSLRQMYYDGYDRNALATAGFTQSTIDNAYGGISLTIVNNAVTGATDILSVSSKFAVIPIYATSISSNAFNSVSSIITGVIFGNQPTINNINSNAFINCDKLTSIIIPSSVTSIGINAFSNCANLTNVLLQRFGDLGKTTLGSNSFQSTTTFGILNSDYSESVATLFSNGYTYNELSTAGFDSTTLIRYYLDNNVLYKDASIHIDSYNNYNITTLDTSIHITDTNTNIEETSLNTNNTNDGTINSVNNFRQFFKLYNNSNLNTHSYNINVKKSVDINYAIFGNSEAGGTQKIENIRNYINNPDIVSYLLTSSDSGARGQFNRGTIVNCSNTVNITNNVSGGSLEVNYNNKSLRTKNAFNKIGIQGNISTNWDPNYNNILTEGYNSNSSSTEIVNCYRWEEIYIPNYNGTIYTYYVSGFTVLDNNVNVTSYQIYNGNAQYVETSGSLSVSKLGTPGTPSYALFHTKIPYAIFTLTTNINLIDANGNTTINIDTTNNGIVINFNDADYLFTTGRKFTIIKNGNYPIIFNCEKSKSYSNKMALKFGNTFYIFFKTVTQTNFTITYTKSNKYYWVIT